MPPKRNVDHLASPTKNQVKKAPKVRIRKEKPPKPKLKTPSILRIKLPPINKLLPQAATNALPKKKMTVAENNLFKIDLANEVAFAQISNKKKVEPEIKEEPQRINEVKTETKPVKKRRQLKRKAAETAVTQILPTEKVTVTDCTKDLKVKPAPKKKGRNNKRDAGVVTGRKLVINENNADSEVEPPPKRRRGKQATKKTNVEVELNPWPKLVINETSDVPVKKNKADSTSKTKAPKSKPRQPVINRPRRNVAKIMTNQSPSILDPQAQQKVNFRQDVMVNLSPSIASRNNSETSLSECPSWTKNISSSSTTTCMTVDSSEFFRNNKKLPIVKLANIDHKLKGNSTVIYNIKKKIDKPIPASPDRQSSSSSDSSSDSDSSSSTSLSTSSISSSPIPRFEQNLQQTIEYKKINCYTDKLLNELKKLDLEIINWPNPRSEKANLNSISEAVLNKLKPEKDILMYCQKFKEVFLDEIDDDGTEILQTTDSPLAAKDPNLNQTRCDDSPMGITGNEKSPQKSVTDFDYSRYHDNGNFTAPMTRDQLERADNMLDDDDDTLSLFAESLTGFDSSRLNSSIPINPPSEIDEYVPQPVSENSLPQKNTYHPTKITEVCEKQNADSTSIYRDAEQLVKLANKITSIPTLVNKMPPPLIIPNTMVLMSSKYKPQTAVKSIVFRGVCFFNLISNCKKTRCTFPHVKITVDDVRNKLSKLSDDVFIQEYMMVRNFPILRRCYMPCYLHECLHRQMTRLLVEMSLDSIIKENVNEPKDAKLKVEIIETALIHLNAKDLKICEDILQYNMGTKLLCDVFIDSIAETQNFSRFKQIFVKLVHFIVDIKKTFSLKATKHILERVCILPFELRVSEALIVMLKNTNVKIFEDPKIGYFEMVISKFDVKLYEELLAYKQNVTENPPEVSNAFAQPVAINKDVELRSLKSERERYTSPDTTKLDTINKCLEEVTITDNFGGNKIATNSSTSSNSEEYKFTANSKFRHWRKPYNGDVRNLGVTRLKRTNKHLVVYGSPAKFPRPLDPSEDMF